MNPSKSGIPTILRQVVHDLIKKHQWTLLSGDDLVNLVMTGTQASVTKTEIVQAVQHHYALVLYGACRQSEDMAKREQAYQELFRLLYRAAYNRWPNIAEDVTQRALMLVYEQIDRCRLPGAFVSFALNKLRHAYQQEMRGRGKEVANMETDEERPDDAQPLPEIDLEQKERMQMLIAAIERLPNQRQQDVVRLKYFDGLSGEVIAERVNTTPGNVRVLLYRALDRLRQDEQLQI